MQPPYARILRLARSGSPGRAWALMERHGLIDRDGDERALTLQARLVKDRAKREVGAERLRLFAQSAELYAKAGAITQGSYPMINAAALSLLAGRKGRSETLAGQVLEALDANPDEAETPYWLGATRAEAHLLTGREVEARAALRAAMGKAPQAWEDHAATIGQFMLLHEELGLDAGWLESIKPPRSLQYRGLMHVDIGNDEVARQIGDFIERENIGFGYGALAAGADIWIAEAILDTGGEVHAVLPCDVDTFRKKSVAAVSTAWLPRFEQALNRVSSLTIIDGIGGPADSAVSLGDAVATGMAMHKAARLCTNFRRLRIVSDKGQPGDYPADATVITARRLQTAPQRLPEPVQINVKVASGNEHEIIAALDDAANVLAGIDRPCAVDCWPAGPDAVPDGLNARLEAMLACAEEGQAIATGAAAFALLGSGAKIYVESAGEMRWARGTQPLFAIVAQ